MPPRLPLLRRRWLLRAVLCLSLGAVTTVGVAWGLRVWYTVAEPSPASYSATVMDVQLWNGASWKIEFHRATGMEKRSVTAPPAPPSGPAFRARNNITEYWAPEPIWSDLFDAASDTINCGFGDDPQHWRETPLAAAAVDSGWGALPELPGRTLVADAAGWPALALWGDQSMLSHWLYQPSGEPERYIATGIGSGWKRIILPYMPVWRGFLLDTLVYAAAFAAIWWAALAMPGAVRRWRTRHEGKCRNCGYNLRGLAAGENGAVVCPECGQDTTTRPSRSGRGAA